MVRRAYKNFLSFCVVTAVFVFDFCFVFAFLLVFKITCLENQHANFVSTESDFLVTKTCKKRKRKIEKKNNVKKTERKKIK